jgi:hypothetical protein
MGRDSLRLPRGGPNGRVTGANGAFGLFAVEQALPHLGLYFEKNGYLPVSLTRGDGPAEHRVVMLRASRLRGRLVLDEGIPTELLNLTWWRDGRADAQHEVGITNTGDLTTDDLAAGVGDLVVRESRSARELARVPRVALSTGEERDPRLDPFDLRGRLHLYRIRVVDAAGQLLDPLYVAESGSPSGTTFHHNPIRLLRTEAGGEITIHASGFAPATLTLLDGEAEVRLEPGTPIVLCLEGIPWPHPGHVIRAVAARKAGGGEPETAKLDELGAARIILPGVGTYSLHLEVILMEGERRRSSTFLFPMSVGGVDGREFELRPGEAERPIAVRVDPAAWQRTLNDLQRLLDWED